MLRIRWPNRPCMLADDAVHLVRGGHDRDGPRPRLLLDDADAPGCVLGLDAVLTAIFESDQYPPRPSSLELAT